ncbi:hypothetical protein [Spirosoma aerolatum]|uniref:hypothetical protein n=1 Tax=Spirosoma aerolatum TaxID=1211326 RepID=UPI0012D34868|nr:hypothetical protein [Spirosoma aerolatum]
MRLFFLLTVLLLSTARMTMSQTVMRLTERGAQQNFIGRSHIEIDLGQRITLLIGFNRYAQVAAHQNIDSVLHLFIADYRKVEDTTRNPTAATHALFRLAATARDLTLHSTPQATTDFRFQDGENPLEVKIQQDTLQIDWVSTYDQRGLRYNYSQVSPYDYSVYLFVNSIHDIERLMRQGGVNSKVRQALDAVQNYKNHDLTSPKMAFDMLQRADNSFHFLHPGSAKKPFLSFQPNVGVGLIRNQWAPSLNLDVHFIPSQLHTVSYSVGYTSTFFFDQSTTDGRFQTFRNDFLNVGLAFYYASKGRQPLSFSRQIVSFNVGIPVYRSGPYFDANTIRLSSTVYHKGLFKVQPEFYMNGFFKKVYPGLRLVVGL